MKLHRDRKTPKGIAEVSGRWDPGISRLFQGTSRLVKWHEIPFGQKEWKKAAFPRSFKVHLWVHDFPFPKVGYAGDERMKPQCLTWGLTSLKLLEILPPKFEAHERVILLPDLGSRPIFQGWYTF